MAYAPFIEDIKIYKGTTFSYQFNFNENGSALDLTTLSDIEVTFSKPGKQIFSHTLSGGDLTISGTNDNELTGTADADTMDIGARSYSMVITFTFPDGSENVYVYFNARIIIGDSQTAHEWNIEIDTDAETASGEQLTGLTSRAIQAASEAEGYANNLNRAGIESGDAGKIERIKSDESGWENVDPAVIKNTVTNVEGLGVDRSGSSHDSQIINDFITNNDPQVLFFPPGEYELENISVESGWTFLLSGWESTKLKLPTGASNPLFNYKGTSTLNGFYIKNGQFQGIGTSSQHGIDLSAASRVNQSGMLQCYISDFNRGLVGTQNDRMFELQGNRFWSNDVGVYIINNHPNFGINDMRENRIAVSGESAIDVQFVGTKFNYNDYGVYAENGTISNSMFVGCQFYKNNVESLVVNGGCTVASSLFVPADNGTSIGVRASGSSNSIKAGAVFKTIGQDFDWAVIFDNPGANCAIQTAKFESIRNCVKIINASSSVKSFSCQNNNAVNAEQFFHYLTGSTFLNKGDLSHNAIELVNEASDKDVIYLENTSGNSPSKLNDNTIGTSNTGWTGSAIAGNLPNAIIKNNIIRNTAGIDDSDAPGATISDNFVNN